MKNPCFWVVVIVGIGILWQCSCPNDPEPQIESVLTHHGPSDKFEQIKINLWNNSPNLGNPVIREAVIMEPDSRAHENDVRALYKWSFHITDNYWIPTTLQVMAWGEYFDFVK